MTSETERARSLALVQTTCLCLLAEALVLLVLRRFTSSYLDAAAMSVLMLGPVSLGLGPLMYRRLLRR